MPRWMWWGPLGLVVLVGALIAFRLGFIDAHLTEGDAIMHYAQRHAQVHGGRSSCAATPGARTWLELRCASADGEHGAERGVMVYGINRFGGLVSERWEPGA